MQDAGKLQKGDSIDQHSLWPQTHWVLCWVACCQSVRLCLAAWPDFLTIHVHPSSALYLLKKAVRKGKLYICFHTFVYFEPTCFWSWRRGGEGGMMKHQADTCERLHVGLLRGRIHLCTAFRSNSQYCISLYCFNWKHCNCPIIRLVE